MMALELTILTSRSSRSLLARRRVERSLLASLDGARRGSLHSKDRLLPSRSGRPLVSCSQRMQSSGARSSAATLIEEEKYGAFIWSSGHAPAVQMSRYYPYLSCGAEVRDRSRRAYGAFYTTISLPDVDLLYGKGLILTRFNPFPPRVLYTEPESEIVE